MNGSPIVVLRWLKDGEMGFRRGGEKPVKNVALMPNIMAT